MPTANTKISGGKTTAPTVRRASTRHRQEAYLAPAVQRGRTNHLRAKVLAHRALLGATATRCAHAAFFFSVWLPKNPAAYHNARCFLCGVQSASECILCVAGSRSDSGAFACIFCNSGQYSATSGSPSCSLCSTGTYSGPIGGYNSCLSCAKGEYASEPGSTACDLCPAGQVRAALVANVPPPDAL